MVTQAHSKRITGYFKKDQLLVFLKEFFPTKTNERIMNLQGLLEKSLVGDTLKYSDLFLEDEDYNQVRATI